MDASFKDHFSGHARDYAAHRPVYPLALVEWLGSVAPGRNAAWDCGCGSGQLTTLLADQFDHVIGTDASQEQVNSAAPHARVEYRCAPAEASGLASMSMDLIVVAQAAHWFDMPRFNAEALRVARPRAAVVLAAYETQRIGPDVDPVIHRYYAETLDGYWPPERRHIENSYGDLAFPFAPFPTPQLEIALDWTCEEFLGYTDTWSATRRLAKAHGRGGFEQFAVELRAVWGGPAVRRTVRWPLAIRAGRVA
ncbi:MAG: class I SAM-dependent methyltransferase [Pseudomonadota bacterium]